MLEQNL